MFLAGFNLLILSAVYDLLPLESVKFLPDTPFLVTDVFNEKLPKRYIIYQLEQIYKSPSLTDRFYTDLENSLI